MNLYEQYKQMMETGDITICGLCYLLKRTKYSEDLKPFKPSKKEIKDMKAREEAWDFWASDMSIHDLNRLYTFTPLRQTIVLLICAMHGELK